tara:strand:- start:2325 stop:3389 length:1065 start_codon:yes stop_codon:yes gene_type:complete
MKLKICLILLAVLTLSLNSYLPYESAFVENIYSQGIFQWVRRVHDFSLGRLPWPNIYILALLLFIGLIFYLKHFKRKISRLPFIWKGVKTLVLDSLVFLSFIMILFYWLWAFNYKRISFEKKNNLPKIEITEDWLFDEIQLVHDSLLALRPFTESDYNHSKVESDIRLSLAKTLPSLGYSVNGNARVREVNPKGILLIWSTAGVYLPFVSEGHIDKGLHSLTKPFTLAHEMSHGYGIGQESTCNFTAFLGCINSENKSIQYSGWLGYFRYLLSAGRRTNQVRYKRFYEEQFHNDILIDLDNIYKELQKYPDILPKLRYFLYDSYLKSHGVTEGMISYSRVIHLAASWKEKQGEF